MRASPDPIGSAQGLGRQYVDTRGGVDMRYRAAMRHSRFVRILKFALPTVAVFAAGLFFVFTYFVPQLPEGG